MHQLLNEAPPSTVYPAQRPQYGYPERHGVVPKVYIVKFICTALLIQVMVLYALPPDSSHGCDDNLEE